MGYSWRIILAILGVIALIILVLVLIFGGGPSNTKGPNQAQVDKLHDYASRGASVSISTDGVINAEETHRSIKISVSSTVRTIEIGQGYQGNILKSEDLTNNESAFVDFLEALENVGFLLTKRNVKNPNLAGQCPLGYRYTFTASGAPDEKTSWTTSCGSSAGGTFAGNFSAVQSLFQKQIPDYNKFVSGVNLN